MKATISKILMDPNREYAYDGENAWQLYHLFVNELDSKIENNYLKINDMSFLVRCDENIEVTNKRYSKNVSYFCDESRQSLATFFIKIQYVNGKQPPVLEVEHFVLRMNGFFYFPLNDVNVQLEPALCFVKWMEIAVDGMNFRHHFAEFNKFIHIKNKARSLKKKIEFLKISLEKSQPHSLFNSIVSDEYLKGKLIKNGSRH